MKQKKEKIGEERINLINGDCTIEMQSLPDACIDVICTDPPYKYLKNQKLEVDFDENMFFKQSKRVLKPDGFIIMFGRGESFYRWNFMLLNYDFRFKEEIIWSKSYTSSPVMAISRCHETCVVYCKGNGKIRQVQIPYSEMKSENYQSILQDVKRIKSALNNTSSLNALLNFVNDKTIDYSQGKRQKHKTTLQSIRVEQDRAVKTLQTIDRGLREKTIIEVKRDHYRTIHPTQKPVRLLERLLQLVATQENQILDPFSGSASTAIACHNLNLKFLGFEIDKEYYELAQKRINEETCQLRIAP